MVSLEQPTPAKRGRCRAAARLVTGLALGLAQLAAARVPLDVGTRPVVASPDEWAAPAPAASTCLTCSAKRAPAAPGFTPLSLATAPLRAVGHPLFMSPHAAPIAVSGGLVFVVNTPADTVDVFRAATRAPVTRIHVGVDPVSVSVRPDGREVWVANHVSDSVSVIDSDPESPTHLAVIATVQSFFRNGTKGRTATRFDEPVGVAFAGNAKAYVALSSQNEIAVINVATRQVTRRLAVNAQDPRALAVRDDRLYVVAFESNNQTQISGCVGPLDGDLCTFDALEHVVRNNNVLSLGIEVDIVKNPAVPDRDLFVFDTTTDRLVEVVEGVGTLLYGVAVDSRQRVYVAQTDARNDANGRAGTLGHGLAEMENRAFFNRITRVDCGGGSCAAPEPIDLEPLPPRHPRPGLALATPFAIQVSDDDAMLVATAAGSNRLFTVDAATGEVLGRVRVQAVPRGVALESADGRLERAWVLNAVANSVSVVDLADRARPRVVATLRLQDPTPQVIKRGRKAFHAARHSTTGTFSCESCHPDGHTDQLLWVLDTPLCSREGCDQIPPRTTMPIRGLRDTAPFHWDGIPGDPFGGRNVANIDGNDPPNCSLGRPVDCTRNLVDGALATTMCRVDEECPPGRVSRADRQALAKFLLSVPYPPAQRRAFTNKLSARAATGFRRFHIDGVPDPAVDGPNVCGSCHRMPFWVSTNTPGTGMEAPTWRGAYDRWLILPQGRQNVVDLLSRSQLDQGMPEQVMWLGASDGPLAPRQPFWNMVTEGSTGFSGAFARQVTLSRATAVARQTRRLLAALELAATEGAIVLEGEGVFLDTGEPEPVALQFVDLPEGGRYVDRATGLETHRRAELVELARRGLFVGTFTGRAGAETRPGTPQPGLWTGGPMQVQSGVVEFPTLAGDDSTLVLSGRHVRAGAAVYVDGRRVPGRVSCQSARLPACDGEIIVVELETQALASGIHFLQVQNPEGLFSNDFIFHVQRPRATPAGAATGLETTRGSVEPAHQKPSHRGAAREP